MVDKENYLAWVVFWETERYRGWTNADNGRWIVTCTLAVIFSSFAVLLVVAVPLEAVTVNPALCPTNKIAPHRRAISWDRSKPRTFGAFYDLLTPNNDQNDPGSLQEKPQEDDPGDCGDIEDYDENDLSSITPQINRKQENGNNRFFFGDFFNGNSGSNQNVPRPPTRPPRPSYPQTRPPYSSGGYFENNSYRPPALQNPSDYVKPVHEDSQETPATYRPGVVGGPIGHVVGVLPVRPTRYPNEATTQTAYAPIRYRPRPTPSSVYSTNQSRPRRLNYNNSIVGSFIDLLFK